MPHPRITPNDIDRFQRDGVVCIRRLFLDYVDILRQGVERNLSKPSERASENLTPGESGRFFDDYCNWTQIPEFETFIRHSAVAEVAANLMRSQSAQIFHEHVLVKEPGTFKDTPWHQDAPYYFLDGMQTISFWVPLDPVQEESLRCVPGSHLWEKSVLPVRWLSEASFYPSLGDYLPVPDPDQDGMAIREYEMVPGDAVAFHFRTLHGARGNCSTRRRRAFSVRLVGDDARYVQRPGRTSPAFPGHSMEPGDRLREDWFPVLYQS